MSISGISSIAAFPLQPLGGAAGAGSSSASGAAGAAGTAGAAGIGGVTGTTPATGTAASNGTDFGSMVANGLDKLQATQANSDALAVKATTGDLTNIHDYMIAANEATVATQLTVAVRNKAVEAFTEIMRMQM